VKVAESGKHSSLLRYFINYNSKKFFSNRPLASQKYLTNLKLNKTLNSKTVSKTFSVNETLIVDITI
jgi:hypothetical protein